MREVFLCSISNVSSGNCPEDCSYCTQSIHYKAKINTYNFKPIETVLQEARMLRSYGVLGFCLVTSGRGIDVVTSKNYKVPNSKKGLNALNSNFKTFSNATFDMSKDDVSLDNLDSKKCEYIANLAYVLKKEDLGLHLIACCGSASKEALKYLKESGIDSYNHNLEASQSFFPSICSTHTWEERLLTCQNVHEVGLALCSGGIFGLGESYEQRIELLKTLAYLKPTSVPINFYIDNIALPIREERLSKDEAIECIMLAREYLPHSKLMVAGGREVIFNKDQRMLFESGVDAIVLGNYLTTKGETPERDLDLIKSYGLKISEDIESYGLSIAQKCV